MALPYELNSHMIKTISDGNLDTNLSSTVHHIGDTDRNKPESLDFSA